MTIMSMSISIIWPGMGYDHFFNTVVCLSAVADPGGGGGGAGGPPPYFRQILKSPKFIKIYQKLLGAPPLSTDLGSAIGVL